MFKALDQVLEPDERFASFVVLDGPQDMRRLSLADHHAAIEKIALPDHVPHEIQSLFDRARHAFLYAWFDYEMTPLAEQQAFATLEFALRRRLGLAKARGLFDLTQKAVQQRIFPPERGGFPLPLMVSSLRNQVAHGSTNFGAPGMVLDTLSLCAELIELLYPNQVTEAATT